MEDDVTDPKARAMNAAMAAIGEAIAGLADEHGLDRESLPARLDSASLHETHPMIMALTRVMLANLAQNLRQAPTSPARH